MALISGIIFLKTPGHMSKVRGAVSARTWFLLARDIDIQHHWVGRLTEWIPVDNSEPSQDSSEVGHQAKQLATAHPEASIKMTGRWHQCKGVIRVGLICEKKWDKNYSQILSPCPPCVWKWGVMSPQVLWWRRPCFWVGVQLSTLYNIDLATLASRLQYCYDLLTLGLSIYPYFAYNQMFLTKLPYIC